MKITSKPVSEARENRGSGNSHLGGIGEGKKEGTGTYIFQDGKWVEVGHYTPKDQPGRGDYGFMRDCDKTLNDYHRFKGSGDREKIKDEYFGKQNEHRHGKTIQDYVKQNTGVE